MKILAIRGCNLASLAGEFEIDLAHGALADAGVFAIVGNTGAGKSTLLDALCVALFDRTPRLTNHSRVIVGRGEEDPGALGAQDVRTLLRRGAAQGWAEVDFESGDERQYRARWSVRRARGQVDGTIQAQTVTLTALDGGERLGGTKTETLEAIHTRLGLTFDQFRRSALLAQGEFATFLRADGKDRSELLERMTGTSIYTRLSVQAHLRATLAEHTLATGRAAALAIAVLEDPARVAADEDRALAEAAKDAARARHAAAEAAARWLAEGTARDDALAAAEAAHTAAVSANAAAEVERAELALRRRAEALRGAWEEAQRRDRDLALAHVEVVAVEAAATAAVTAQRAISERRAGLAVLHAPIRAARMAARLVERAAPATSTAAIDLARAAEADATWLAARGALAPEVAAWSELDAKFAQYAATQDAIISLERARAEHTASLDKLTRARGALVTEHQVATAKLGEAQRKAESFSRRRGLSLEAARRSEDEARIRLGEVDRLVAVASTARAAQTAREEIDRRLAELAEGSLADATARTEAGAARATALAVRSEREHAVAELRKAAGYEHARAELVDGEPCPLCGADDHPWRDRGAFHDVIAAAKHRLDATVAELDTLTATLAHLDARAEHRKLDQVTLVRSRATADAAAADAVARWSEQLTSLGELSLVRDPLAPGAEAFGLELHAAAKKKLEEAKATRSQTEAATKAAADAQAEVQLGQANVDATAARLAEIDRKVADLEAALGRTAGERAGRMERHAELAAELDAAIARWTAAVAEPPPRARGRAQTSRDHLRTWITELAVAWRARADRVAHAEAVLAAELAALEGETRLIETTVAEQGARRADAVRRREEAIVAVAAAAAVLEGARAEAGFAPDELHRLLSLEAARVDDLVGHLGQLERAVVLALTLVTERRRRVEEHAAARPASLADAADLPALAAALSAAEHHVARAGAVLAADDDARVRRAEALAKLATAEAAADVDRILGEVIGSHDGKKFRSFAQSLTLDGLLSVANGHLDELAPRYQLERVPNHDLELQVIDRDLGDEVRSVQSLSGGESFLVSLALALGLSSMSAHDVRVRTLLIDEGFGTLDPTTLDSALAVLDALQARGRQVGVISHVPQLVERVGAHIRVEQRGGGRSVVIVA